MERDFYLVGSVWRNDESRRSDRYGQFGKPISAKEESKGRLMLGCPKGFNT